MKNNDDIYDQDNQGPCACHACNAGAVRDTALAREFFAVVRQPSGWPQIEDEARTYTSESRAVRVALNIWNGN